MNRLAKTCEQRGVNRARKARERSRRQMEFDRENEPVLIFTGAYEETLFLTSFLEGSNIPATMLAPPKRGGVPWHSVYVLKRTSRMLCR